MDIKAHGKINLSLDVTGVLDNGYHSVSMVMQSVELCDIVSIVTSDTGEITLKTDNSAVPDGRENIAYKAAELMKKEFSLSCGFNIKIQKNIPVAGGMAGGSTDAAAVLHGVNELCSLGLSTEKLMKIGLALGADVPFCIQKKPALAEGIGEKLTNIKGLSSDLYILLVNPNVPISTKEIYNAIDKKTLYNTIDNNELILSLKNNDLKKAKNNMKNVMESVTRTFCPEISEIIDTLLKNGAAVALMSGSGATCYGVFYNETDAKKAEGAFLKYYTKITKPIS